MRISTGAHDEVDTIQAISKLQHEVRPTILSIELLNGTVRPKIAISPIYYELHFYYQDFSATRGSYRQIYTQAHAESCINSTNFNFHWFEMSLRTVPLTFVQTLTPQIPCFFVLQ